jgi:hypothetical protein
MSIPILTFVSCSEGENRSGTAARGAPNTAEEVLDAYLAATEWERHADSSFVVQYTEAEGRLRRLGTGGSALVARRLHDAPSGDVLALLRASAVFGEMSLPCLADVQRYMESPDPAVANMAMGAAANISPGDKRTVARVVAKAIGERDGDALLVFAQLGEHARPHVPSLWHLVASENLLATTELEPWHFCACQALGSLRVQEAASLLTELALRTGHGGLCRSAASMSGPDLVPMLLSVLAGSEGASRQGHAATMAGVVGDPRLTAGLVALYEETADEVVRWRAASALADMPAVGAKNAERLLATVRGRDDRIRRLIMSVVARAGAAGESSRAVLADLASNDADPHVRRTAGAVLRGEPPR